MKSAKQLWFDVLGKGMVQTAKFASITWPIVRHLVPTRIEFEDNESVWMKSAGAYTPSPALDRDIEVDMAIIGGGFTGISTAYHFSRRYPEKRIALLEAKVVANGSSGRSTGLMLNFLTNQYSYGEDMFAPIYKLTSETILEIREIIKRHDLNVGLRSDGTLTLLTAPDRAAEAEKECQFFNKVGIPIRYMSGDEVRSILKIEGVHGAQFDPNSGWINGVEFLREMKRVIISQGVNVFENTVVTRIGEGSQIELTTDRGRIKAKAIMLASGSYTANLGYFQEAFFPQYSHVFSTDRLTSDQLRELSWQKTCGFSDDFDMISYASSSPQGHLLFGGGDPKAYSYWFGGRTRFENPRAKVPNSYAAIRRNLLHYLPQTENFPVTHYWSGLLDMTLKRNILLGVRGAHRNIFYSLGYCGHGIVTASLAGKVITDIYSGDDQKWKSYPFYQDGYAPIPPEPFRWIGYHLFKKLSGKSPRV